MEFASTVVDRAASLGHMEEVTISLELLVTEEGRILDIHIAAAVDRQSGAFMGRVVNEAGGFHLHMTSTCNAARQLNSAVRRPDRTFAEEGSSTRRGVVDELVVSSIKVRIAFQNQGTSIRCLAVLHRRIPHGEVVNVGPIDAATLPDQNTCGSGADDSWRAYRLCQPFR